MLEVKDGRWFGRLDDDFPKVKWMRRVYPRVDYTHAPWTVAGTVDGCYAWAAELKHPRFKGGIDISSKFWYSTSRYRSSKQETRAPVKSTVREEFVEKSSR